MGAVTDGEAARRSPSLPASPETPSLHSRFRRPGVARGRPLPGARGLPGCFPRCFPRAPLTAGLPSRGHAGPGEAGLEGRSGGRAHTWGPGKAGSAAWAGSAGRGPRCRRMWWGARGGAGRPGVRGSGGPRAGSGMGRGFRAQPGRRGSRTSVPGCRVQRVAPGGGLRTAGEGPTQRAGTGPVGGGETELKQAPKRRYGPGV